MSNYREAYPPLHRGKGGIIMHRIRKAAIAAVLGLAVAFSATMPAHAANGITPVVTANGI
jgi:hypothetical protein